MEVQKSVTMKEIAKITGFSISTVSKAFNRSYEISQGTREKINDVANKLGYKPNRAAITLRSGKNYVIAVVVPSIEDPFYARIFHGIQNSVANTNYSIITCITRESYEKEVKLLEKIDSRVDAFIIAPAEETLLKKEFAHLQDIIDRKKPLVIVNSDIEDLDCSKVLSNNKVAIKEVTFKAFQRGYQNVALISSSKKIKNQRKIKAFTQEDANILSANFEKFILNVGQQNLEEELAGFILEKNIDCIITAEEETTFIGMRVADKLKKKIPSDLGFVAYISEKVAENLVTPISTINQHRKTIGFEAVNLLFDQLEGNNDSVNRVVSIRPTLIDRKSF